MFLYKAIDYDGLKCPDSSPAGCAASVAGFITSITWIASYLSFAANACGQAVNSGALCAGDWTALMANFGEMATVGAAVKEDCDFSKNYLELLELVDAPPDTPAWRAFIPPAAAGTVDTITKVDALKTATGHENLETIQAKRVAKTFLCRFHGCHMLPCLSLQSAAGKRLSQLERVSSHREPVSQGTPLPWFRHHSVRHGRYELCNCAARSAVGFISDWEVAFEPSHAIQRD